MVVNNFRHGAQRTEEHSCLAAGISKRTQGERLKATVNNQPPISEWQCYKLEATQTAP